MRDLIEYSEQEIDALQEGAETDALVAAEILDWADGYGNALGVCPHHSSEIGAAWLVVERLKSMYIWLYRLTNHSAGYKCMLGPAHEYQSVGDAKDAPLAICKAALKAVQAMKLREVAK